MLQFNPPHPGEILKADYLDPLELTITDVAGGLGIARKNLSAIINGRAGVSSEMALRLSEAFNTTPELWLNLQANYDLWKARRAPIKRKIKRFFKAKKLEI
ncbi:MAG: HigA family addiction module antidote protein [Bacteroidetes bacterium]|nr:HigA family addiction module antidote protein [Bacteroidota bacterium]MBI3482068.1 HigA family addiction module antidote protein [Bacteroidota bacterium]